MDELSRGSWTMARKFAVAVAILGLMAGTWMAAGPARAQVLEGESGLADSTVANSLRALADSLGMGAAADSLRVLADSLVSGGLADSTVANSLRARADSLGTSAVADSLRALADSLVSWAGEEVGGGGAPREAGFHPNYRLGYRSDRDSQSYQQSVQNLSFALGDRLTVTTGASLNNRKSKNTDQQTLGRQSKTDISYALTPAVRIQASLSLNGNENRTRQKTRTVNSDNFAMGTAFDQKWGPLQAHFDLNGGTAGNRNPFYNSRGKQGQVQSQVSYSPFPWLQTSTDYQGSLARQSSKSLTLGNETKDREVDNTLNGRMTLDLRGDNSMALGWTAEGGRYQRPDTLQASGRQETKTTRNRGVTMTSSWRPLKDLQLSIDADWSRRLTDYALQRSAYALNRDRGTRIAARYVFPTKTDVGIGFTSRLTRGEYRPEPESTPPPPDPPDPPSLPGPPSQPTPAGPDRTGNTTFRTLNASISQPLGPKASVEASGKIDLQIYEFDDRAYDQDRDVLDQRLTFRGKYTPFTLLNTDCDFTVLDRRTIYIRASRSSQNNRAQTYSLKPSLTFQLTPQVTVMQRYGLDATYTYYTFNEDINSIARSASLTTSLGYNLTSRVRISATHDYRDTDQGSLFTEGGQKHFSRQKRNERQEMQVSVDYRATGLVNFTVESRLQVDRNWEFRLANGEPNPQPRKPTTSNQYLAGKAHGQAAVRKRLTFSYQVALNLGDGPRVPDTQREYRTASVELSYKF